jgi:hypothetical protein
LVKKFTEVQLFADAVVIASINVGVTFNCLQPI